MKGRIVAPVALLLAAVACGDVPTQPLQKIPEEADRVEFSTIEDLSGFTSGIVDGMRLVIRDESLWTRFVQQYQSGLIPEVEVPSVDFNSSVVIVAAMGHRGTGGYVISFEGMWTRHGRLWAAVKEIDHEPSCTVTQSDVQPVITAVVPLVPERVTFVEIRETTLC